MNELLNDYDADELRTCSLIIPKGTQITYVSNVENSLMLHYTDDIYVFFINNNRVPPALCYCLWSWRESNPRPKSPPRIFLPLQSLKF